MKLDFNDILIKPTALSQINSRKQVNPYYNQTEEEKAIGKKVYRQLPLITAPMDTVVDENNIGMYLATGVNVCLPRGLKATRHKLDGGKMIFESYSLEAFSINFLSMLPPEQFTRGWGDNDIIYALIDVANGHMSEVERLTKAAKKKWGSQLQLMVGNVANADTYAILSEAGADYVRVGIGNGNGCLTTQQTGVGHPLVSLIQECHDYSYSLKTPAKIVADGGMKSYSDIIKALAVGADYVMVGSLFNKALESCGETYVDIPCLRWIKLNPMSKLTEKLYKRGIPLGKKFRGMSTKEVQKSWGNQVLKTSEGVVRTRRVEYTLLQWHENFISYLKSAMSYTGAEDIHEFIGNPEIINISNNAYERFKK